MDVIVHENYIQREQEILYYIILAFHAAEILLNQGKLIARCILNQRDTISFEVFFLKQTA